MSDIVIMEKPENVSYETIHQVLYAAHESNRQQGIVVHTALMSAEEIREHIGPEGKCFVAMDGDKVVGTVSYAVRQRNKWYHKGPVVDRVLAGVLPEYKGRHISTLLFQKVSEEAAANGYYVIESRTAENNVIVQKINLKDGFRYVNFFATKADHYSVTMMQWLDGCPSPTWKTDLAFRLRRLITKLRYKPGKIKRFGI